MPEQEPQNQPIEIINPPVVREEFKEIEMSAASVAPAAAGATQEIPALKKEIETAWEKTAALKALDLAEIKKRFEGEADGMEITSTFVLHGKDRVTGQEREDEFTATFKLDKKVIDFTINSGDAKVFGRWYTSRDGKRALSMGNLDEVNLGDLKGFGYYGQLMDGLLQGVDFTENSVTNAKTWEAIRGFGEHMPPSVFARESPLVAARKGFICFLNIDTSIDLIGIRLPDELKDILEIAKEWDTANYNEDIKLEFREKHPDYDVMEEAKKIEKYVQEHQEVLSDYWGFYPRDCEMLLELQIERFEEMAKGIDRYHPKRQEKKVKKIIPKPGILGKMWEFLSG